MGIEAFIKKHIRYQQHWNKKLIDRASAKWQELEEDTFLDNCVYSRGSKFKVFETTNFGWIVFSTETRTPEGNTPNKRIIKW
jgi:hypothetical protein